MFVQNYYQDFEDNDPNIKLLYAVKSTNNTVSENSVICGPFIKLYYIISGQGFISIDKENFALKCNDIFLINSEVQHEIIINKNQNLEYIVIGISGINFLVETSGNYQKVNLFHHHCHSDNQEILFYIQKILNEFNQKNEYYDLICADLLKVVILTIIRHADSALTIAPSLKLGEDTNLVKDYIDINYAKNITLDDLSSIALMNKYYLVHEFKRLTGFTPIDYLITTRIEASKALLETTNKPIEDIAKLVGFKSQSYFNQVFKHRTNETPSHYRKRYFEIKK